MLPYQMIAGGTFTVTVSTAVDVICQSQDPPDFIVARNLGSSSTTGWGELNDAQEIEWFWERSMSQDTAKGIRQTSSGSDPAMIATFASSDGIRTYDTANPPTYAPLAATAITGSAGTFVVSMANTGTIAVGDYVRLYSTTGELQIAGYTFQVTAVTTNVSITLGYMASGGQTFAADATAGQVIKFIPNRMYPRWRFISGITQAAQAVVFFTEKNDFTPGEIVSFRVSSAFGMDEINNREVRVLSVTNSATVSSITIDLDTTGFTAFTFPTSAVAAAGVSPAVCVPSASGVVPDAGSATIPQEPPGTNLRDAFDNRNVRIIHFGGALFANGTTGDVWMWQAYKYDQYNNQ
jgi:hypothetical protein